jgi:hypothetical protein
MAGAYTAKPDVPEETDLPPGWNLIWPHPGPWPPGYTPILALGLDAQATMVPGAVVSDVVSTLTDQVDYVTTEPATQITWTAAWDDTDEALSLKLSGGSELLASVSVSYTDVGSDFWGAEPDFEFDVIEADNGRSFTLTANSTPFSGYSVLAEDTITVVLTPPVKRATFTITWSGSLNGGSASWNQFVERFDSLSSPYDPSGFDDPATAHAAGAYVDIIDGDGGSPYQESDEYDECTVTFPTDNSAMVSIAAMPSGKFYALWFRPELYDAVGTLTLEAEFFVNDDLVDTASYGHSVDGSDNFDHIGWGNIDVDNNTIITQ